MKPKKNIKFAIINLLEAQIIITDDNKFETVSSYYNNIYKKIISFDSTNQPSRSELNIYASWFWDLLLFQAIRDKATSFRFLSPSQCHNRFSGDLSYIRNGQNYMLVPPPSQILKYLFDILERRISLNYLDCIYAKSELLLFSFISRKVRVLSATGSTDWQVLYFRRKGKKGFLWKLIERNDSNKQFEVEKGPYQQFSD